MLSFDEYARLDGTALAEMIRRRDVSAAEVREVAIAAIERFNPKLNAVLEVLRDSSAADVAALRSDAPFAGVPFLIKELVLHARRRALPDGQSTRCRRIVSDRYRIDGAFSSRRTRHCWHHTDAGVRLLRQRPSRSRSVPHTIPGGSATAPVDRAAVRAPRWARALCRSRTRTTAAVRFEFRHRATVWSV